MNFVSIEEQVQEGIRVLKGGGVIAFPTDTLFGLGAGLASTAGIRRIFAIKQRRPDQALPVLLASTDQIDELAIDIPVAARCLAVHFMPGALTLVLRRSAKVPSIVVGGGATVGLRVPAHPVPVALIRGLGTPITGTSANLSGYAPGKNAAEVRQQIGCLVDYIIDAGPPPGGIESTVVDLTGTKPVVLREGAVPRSEIEKACPVLGTGPAPYHARGLPRIKHGACLDLTSRERR